MGIQYGKVSLMKIRTVLIYTGHNKPDLIAEAELTEQEVNHLKTKCLISDHVTMNLDTWVYWYNGGNPPVPIYLNCVRDIKGSIPHIEPGNYTNTKTVLEWHFELNTKEILGG